jgi:hypothetical protein
MAFNLAPPNARKLRLYEVLPALTVLLHDGWQLRVAWRASTLLSTRIDSFVRRPGGDDDGAGKNQRAEPAELRARTNMIAWEPEKTDERGVEKPAMPGPTGLLYRLTVAFPAWAGAILALYAIFMPRLDVFKSGALRIRPR